MDVDPSRAHRSVALVAYDERWPDRFAATRAQLAATFPAAEIEHIGSTSVSGLSAKDTIDVAVGVPDVTTALSPAILAELAALGFTHRPSSFADNPDHAFLDRIVADHRTDHVHVMTLDSATYRDRLVFRDYLRASPEVVARYEDRKRDLAEHYAEQRSEYVDRKSLVVDELMRGARAWADRSGW
ncbi:GrpB family protein [Pseudactinotalea sp.]|uniref:GrpB family protein n=1 Tax=Pseudactinotalea sp. TaxID=1926260 RepID=UPI003B3B0B8C